jgi:hypothetical protein
LLDDPACCCRLVVDREWPDDDLMTDPGTRMRVTLHLVQQTTVAFDSADLWPMHGPYGRFGANLASFAEEVMRRLSADQYLGFHSDPATITVIPRDAVKRIDFTEVAGPPAKPSPSASG